MTAAEWIEKYQLQPHPEGGWYRETWRSELSLTLEGYSGPRSAGTAIVFLLEHGKQSRFHRVTSAELWFFHAGDPLRLSVRATLEEEGREIHLGETELQALVPGGAWQAATPASGPHGYSLVSCVVVPGFDFADFELVDRGIL